MQKRFAIPLVCLAVFVAAEILFTLHRWREPSYQGTPLKVWLARYDSPSQDLEADEAIRQMGASTLPFLVEMANANDSPSKLALTDLADQLDLLPETFTPAEQRNRHALAAFRALGAAAKPAIPQLMKSLRQDTTQHVAILALGAIGADSVAPLANALTDPRASMRVAAAKALGECAWPINAAPGRRAESGEIAAFMSAAGSALPGLIRGLKDSDAEVRAAVALALGDFRHRPALTVPALMEALQDNDAHVRRAAALALARFRASAESAVPALLKTLNDPDSEVRDGAAFALRFIDPETAERVGAR